MSGFEIEREVALRFLQTVVVVDDQAYTPVEENVERASVEGDFIDNEYSQPDAYVEPFDLPDPQDFDTEIVVEAFADLGINCAVLAPDPVQRDADMFRIEKLARRSDIVILDWVINPRDNANPIPQSDDQTSLEFIGKILKEDFEDGGRMRLICIYTGAQDAAVIVDKICNVVNEDIRNKPPTGRGNIIDFESTRVVVLGKARTYPVTTIESIESADLPGRVVDEFARFVATGLLREIALESLSSVRDESHRLLRRFDVDLDPALISHRSTTSPADAEQFAKNLVGSELGAIVLNADVAAALSDDRVNDYIDKALAGRDTAFYWKAPRGGPHVSLPMGIVEKALKMGINRSEEVGDTSQKLSPRYSRTPLLLRGDAKSVRAQSTQIDSRFSMLSSLARDPAFEGKGSSAPIMQLGVIISDSSTPTPTTRAGLTRGELASAAENAAPASHWVCLQPLCDSVRIDGPTKFPLLPLRPGSTNFNYVVEHEGDHIALEHAGLKISEMELVSFRPDAALKVVNATWDGARWVFSSDDGGTYIWRGSLRLDKAHKLLHSVVSTAGRIGIDEYEYLRGAARP